MKAHRIIHGLLLLSMAGCSRKLAPVREPPLEEGTPPVTEIRKTNSPWRMLREECEQRERESLAFRQAQQQHVEAVRLEQSRTKLWQTATALLGGSSIAALLIGAAMGAKARHDVTPK